MSTIETINQELTDLRNAVSDKNVEVQDKQNQVDNFEMDESDYEESYQDMLNECYEGVFNILPSTILENCDPIAYRCGLSDYVDCLELDDDPDYKELTDELAELIDELHSLEEELEIFEAELATIYDAM